MREDLRFTRTSVFDGIHLEVDPQLADKAEEAWRTYGPMHLSAYADEPPTRSHYRTLANRLTELAQRARKRSQEDRKNFKEWENAARVLNLFADAADQFRTGRLPNRSYLLHAGDRIRVRGRVPFVGMEPDQVYEVIGPLHLKGSPAFSFRLVDKNGKITRHTVGPFRAGALEAFLKTAQDASLGVALLHERIHSSPLDG